MIIVAGGDKSEKSIFILSKEHNSFYKNELKLPNGLLDKQAVIVEFHQDKLYIQRYKDSNVPEGETLTCFDLKESHYISMPDVIFVGIMEDGKIWARKNGGNKFYWIDWNKRELNGPYEKQVSENFYAGKNIYCPVSYDQENEYFNELKLFLNSHITEGDISLVNYLETPNTIIMSVFTIIDTKYKEHFFVFNEKGEIVFEDILQENAKGLGTDTFFVIENHIFAIREKKNLDIYEIRD